MPISPYKRIHVVVNSASSINEPILNVLNDAFHQYDDVEWSIGITEKFGDATEQAREAAQNGADLDASNGGDGTQHETANGTMGTTAVMGVLRGGTGNSFAAVRTPSSMAIALCGLALVVP